MAPKAKTWKIAYLKQIPLGCIFRYRREFYKRVAYDLARNIEWETGDFIDLDESNFTDAVAISINEEIDDEIDENAAWLKNFNT